MVLQKAIKRGENLKVKLRMAQATAFVTAVSFQIQAVTATDLFAKGETEAKNLYTNINKLVLPLAAVVAVVSLILYFMSSNPQKAEKRKDWFVKVLLTYGAIVGLGYFFVTVKNIMGEGPALW